MSSELPAPEKGIDVAGGLVRSASVLALGNAASRALGLVREMVIAAYFGASGEVSAFRVASQVPVLLYDFLVGGMLSAALVPVLSEYAEIRSGRVAAGEAYRRLVSVLLTLFAILLTVVTVVLVAAAPLLAGLLAAGFAVHDAELLALTTHLIRLAAPAVWLFSMAGLCTAMLYSLHRFHFPAAATAVYNLGIVIAAPFLAAQIGIFSLVAGMLIGGLAQLAIMWADLRRVGLHLFPVLTLRHPALAKIIRLYVPIAAGLIVALFQVGLDRRLASGTGAQSIAWMSNATTLQQMPLGLISIAVSLAALPQLSQHFVLGNDAEFRSVLVRGLRTVLMLITPAAIGLWILGEPLTRLLFERNEFTAFDTIQVVQALNIYVLGMLFAAVDFPLNYAFYARNNTWLPALVGILSVGVYIGFAFGLVNQLGFLGLVWADTSKQASHALVMTLLAGFRIGWLRTGLSRGMVTIAVAGLGMYVIMWGLTHLWFGNFAPGFGRDLLWLAVAGIGGVGVYGTILHYLGFDEIREFVALCIRRLSAHLV